MKRFIVLVAFAGLIILSYIPIHNASNATRLVGGRYQDLTVVLDAGHGGRDGGAVSASGILEKDVVLQVTRKVETHLRLAGFNVVLTRDGDYDLAPAGAKKRKNPDLNRRAEIFNTQESENTIAVSIHANATTKPDWKGAQTFYDPILLENQQLAGAIMQSMGRNIAQNREAKPISNILILRKSTVPTALVEIGFLSNPDEAKKLNQTAYQEELAYAIFEGILYFLDNPVE
ncbi:MAG: N-acetylmuramoyl-L-alanine amidase [Turicibacter sp.]|nr:N-acetylmuramoyl-L-alanine amidase [Turicibacter sp.]